MATSNASYLRPITLTPHGCVRHNSEAGELEQASPLPRFQWQEPEYVGGTLQQAVSSAAEEREHSYNFLRNAFGLQQQQQQQMTAEEAVSLLNPPTRSAGKRKRGPSRVSILPEEHGDYGTLSHKNLRFMNYDPRKRQRGESPHSEIIDYMTIPDDSSNDIRDDSFVAAAVAAATRPANMAVEEGEGDTSFFLNEYPPTAAWSDARAAGVYSAAALFRKPSTNSKKFTRPPMSKLFSSLQLTPENFLRVQAAAKAYMLDPEFPQRQDCVGNRGMGDTDMVKLRLYNCVKEFLDKDGIGVRFFGVESEGREARIWEWPTDENRAISLCTPLLRRMVTNERQRQYANEARKVVNGGEGTTAGPSAVTTFRKTILRQKRLEKWVEGSASKAKKQLQEQHSKFDPLLARIEQYGSDDSATTVVGKPTRTTPRALINLEISPAIYPPLALRFSIMRTNLTARVPKLLGHFTRPATSCANLNDLKEDITMILVESHLMGESAIKLSALGPNGIQVVDDGDVWTKVVREAEEIVWMERVLRVLVEV